MKPPRQENPLEPWLYCDFLARLTGSFAVNGALRDAWITLRPCNYRNCHGHPVFAVGGETQLVVGDIPGFDANHTAPGRVAEIGHGGRLFGPGVPHHARPGADFFDDDLAAPSPPPAGSCRRSCSTKWPKAVACWYRWSCVRRLPGNGAAPRRGGVRRGTRRAG